MTSSRHVAKLANLALGCVVGAALTAAADAQTVKIRHVGVLVPGGSYAAAIEGLRDGLKELGLQDGKQVVLHVRDLKGDLRGVGLEAKALEQQKVDLIVSVTTSVSLATKRSGVKVPIVFYAGSDPVEAGLVRSFATPGVNMTGVCSLVSDLTAKRLQLLKEIVPDLNRVATLYDPDSAVSRRTLALARDAAQKLGFQYVAREVRSVGELTQELQALTHEDAGALFLVSGAMVSASVIQRAPSRVHPPRACRLGHLLVNPAVGFLHAVAQPRVRFPAEIFFDQRIIAVTAVDTFGRRKIVAPFQFNLGDVFHDVDELIDRDEFTRLATGDKDRLMALFPADGCVTWGSDAPEPNPDESGGA